MDSKSNSPSSPDAFYYNFAISNSNPTTAGQTYGTTKIPSIVYTYNDLPICNNPNDYYCSIQRFEVPCSSIPVIAYVVWTDADNVVTDVNKGVYSFTLRYEDTYSDQIFYEFIPQVERPNNIPPTGTVGQTFSDYYFVFDYSWFIRFMNTALARAVVSLKALVPALSGLTDPFFYYDPKTQLITLYADSAFYDEALANPVYIYFNSICIPILTGFPFNSVSSGSANGADEYFIIQNHNTLNQQTINGVLYDLMSQEYVSVSYWSPLQSIVLSTSMNIVSESFSISYGTTTNQSQNVNYQNILTDFIPDLSGANEAGISSKIFIFNAPTTMYRPFQFKQQNPLYIVSLTVSFTDIFGNTYPLYIQKYNNVNVKLQFMKKEVYRNSLRLTL